jgi:hypothetical protein
MQAPQKLDGVTLVGLKASNFGEHRRQNLGHDVGTPSRR